MGSRMAGKVALITGAARGQGRAHALRLAEEGADIVAVDLCAQLDSVPYPMGTEADLAETAKLVENLDRRVVTRQADVRDLTALEAVVDEGMATFGRLDVVVVNAGIASFGAVWELTEDAWQEMIDVNLTGAWKTVRATVPRLVDQGEGGSVILTSSVAGLVAFPNLGHYTAAKFGITGLTKALAVELAPHRIRANSIHPSTVDTGMVQNAATYQAFTGMPGASREEAAVGMKAINGLPIPWSDPVDIANAVLYLASDESRYVTGTALVIDAGATAPFKIPHS